MFWIALVIRFVTALLPYQLYDLNCIGYTFCHSTLTVSALCFELHWLYVTLTVSALCFELYWLYVLSQYSYPISSMFWIVLVIRFVTALLPYQLYVLNCIGYTFCHSTLTVSALCFELYWLYVLSQHSYRISSTLSVVAYLTASLCASRRWQSDALNTGRGTSHMLTARFLLPVEYTTWNQL